tara:strand:+ start:8351 stop:8914 length:564 start_codon:yes stop_codon:yes gene_type:complete
MNFNIKNKIKDKYLIDKLFATAYDELKNLNHINVNNYKDTTRTQDYIRFDVLYKDDDVVAFGGMCINDAWHNCVRITDRYYLFKKYRSTHIGKHKLNPAGNFIIPKQIMEAHKLGMCPFISMQNLNKRSTLNILSNYLNKNYNINTTILDNMKNTCCGRSNNPNCIQSILTLSQHKQYVDNILPNAN